MLKQKIREQGKKIKEAFIYWRDRLYLIGTEKEKTSREFRFLFLSWAFFLLFFTFFILAEKNPFNLLVPFNVFQIPRFDQRDEVQIYVSDGEDLQIPVKRKLLVHEDSRERIFQFINEVAAPPYFSNKEKVNDNDTLVNPKKLLNLHDSLTQVWFLENESRLVLDWNAKQLESVLMSFRLPRSYALGNENEEENQENTPVDAISYYTGPENFVTEEESVTRKRRLSALSATLKAIEATLFRNHPNLKVIEHRLDGRSQTIDQIPNPMNEPRKRETFGL
ncbi:hypothetical protein LPTSP4_11470 [Leptospira ryugenii]|uniref:Uncharacterized protein n=1 Tax=Leptospira ryugenii TaxID=1917863 RepID=A0A2P2DYC6_9LEPT|nr:hypothetical protein [Leptospira ryugenii]GBF49631.1 hypothetical protein LPTSP4_11470 [Leptospira ryugenii]